jgi:DNA invertase Pin-like site-specific DNA recombinase
LTTLEELKTNGVEVVSVADGFDLSGPHAEIIVAVMAWAAKMERLAINERISAARERIEAEGGRWGRPSRVDRATRARAVKMHVAGRSIRRIAQALKVPRSTIGRAIMAARIARKRGPAGGSSAPGETSRS